ncbi:cytochrome c-type heme lyase subunit nrfE [Vibrio maritimus]|uniref:Cytochrome c-type heme lyase subunit nrfE n=1 Tax=Vibrio maritimus TaxID=990268 RepID=A0A090T6C1_9VIBR|nr:cytochrome c-type heme lyase subunit nrfE [Vibrio maritimus]
MLGYIGLFTLIAVAVTSSLAVLHGVFLAIKDQQNVVSANNLNRFFSAISFMFALSAIAILAYAFAVDDFSIRYISDNSNHQLHLVYKLAATWGGHQGSMLFWVVTLSLWGVVIAWSKQRISAQNHASWIMQCIVAIFAWFTLAASNPFELNAVIPLQGRDLNPMLQDIGLIIHPPLLYIGYVGFASVLAMALGSLLTKHIDFDWIPSARIYTLIAWLFLTAGIAVGSWWAYYELGWGGWWFWDPVENASLLPWLTATALLHTMMVARSKQLVFWTYSLAFITFCLSILGTFIVRSGVLTSVHAFAVDPTKGFSLLAILTLVFVFAFVALIARADSIKSLSITSLVTKPFLVLMSANLFVLATAVVVFGTFYPMVYELAGLGNISVGAPYFNLLFGPIAIVSLFVIGAVPFLSWSNTSQKLSIGQPVKLLVVSLMVAFAIVLYCTMHYEPVGAQWSTWALFTVWASLWVLMSHIAAVFAKTKLTSLSACIAHIGIAIAAFGCAMNAEYSYEITKRLGPDSQVDFGDYHVTYVDTHLYVGRNFTAEQAVIDITDKDNDQFTRIATPEKRHYSVRVMTMTEPSMTPLWHGDIYISLGDKVDTTDYAVRIQFKAFVRWIWFGALLVCISACTVLLRSSKNVVASKNASLISSLRETASD